MAGMTGVYGQLGRFGEAAGAAMKNARGFLKTKKAAWLGGAGGRPVRGSFRPKLLGTGQDLMGATKPRGGISTAVKSAKVGLRRAGFSGSDIGAAKRAAPLVGGIGAVGYGLGRHRGKRAEKNFMMRGIR